MKNFPAIILAGGRATRLGGGDKGLLDLGGHPILSQVIARLSPQCAPLALNANGDPARFATFSLPVLADDLPDHAGPLAGILVGMEWAARQKAEAVISVAADTPFFPADLARQLAKARGPSGLALAATQDGCGIAEHPTFGLWPVALRGVLRDFLLAGRRRLRDFAREHAAGQAIWPGDPQDPFFNINTPADLARARSLLKVAGDE